MCSFIHYDINDTNTVRDYVDGTHAQLKARGVFVAKLVEMRTAKGNAGRPDWTNHLWKRVEEEEPGDPSSGVD